MEIGKLKTESRNPNTTNIDRMSVMEILSIMNHEDHIAIDAIKNNLSSIEKAVEAIVSSLRNGGRLIYIGAGTSGRMGVIDAAECMPTFGVTNQIIAILAGGKDAMYDAVEGAEDNSNSSIDSLKKIKINNKDIIVGIAASGRTPYVKSALNYANECGCNTVSIACNVNSEIGKIANIPIEIETGAEVITGSTRLKAGTVQKIVCNMLSTTAMIKMGKVYSNLMVDMIATNNKLKDRSIRIVQSATNCTANEASKLLIKANGNCKLAIVMKLSNKNLEEAKKLLENNEEKIYKALENKDY